MDKSLVWKSEAHLHFIYTNLYIIFCVPESKSLIWESFGSQLSKTKWHWCLVKNKSMFSFRSSFCLTLFCSFCQRCRSEANPSRQTLVLRVTLMFLGALMPLFIVFPLSTAGAQRCPWGHINYCHQGWISFHIQTTYILIRPCNSTNS